jgi:AraC-like DNA-binding protein
MRTADSIVSGTGEASPFGQALERLMRAIPAAQALITTTLPRGGLQVIHALSVEPPWIRTYSREHSLLDVVAWEALRGERTQRLSDVLAHPDQGVARVASRFQAAALSRIGAAHYMCAPLDSPLLEGYPGAVHLHRGKGAPDFSPDEVRQVAEFAANLASDNADVRRARAGENDAPPHPLVHHPSCRQFAISHRKLVFPERLPAELDAVLRQNLLDAAAQRLEHLASHQAGNDAMQDDASGDGPALASIPRTKAGPMIVPDETGDQWVFRAITYEFFPAITRGRPGPVAIVSLPPECDAWALLRAADIQADSELARLIPALHYMHANFSSNINLGEVARSVNLSPFHFHRRFSELLGTTPKHFLFDCQIVQAKRHLAEGEKGLAEIAADTGFSHQSHFTSRFRQATGFTPTKWKRLAGAKARSAAHG